MLTLLKNANCYCPKHCGVNDILLCGEKIYKIRPEIKTSELVENTFECSGLLAFPGLIDQHVHITGGGGECGFASRIREIEVGSIFRAGITTVVGLLGADGVTRSLENLFAKAGALEDEGLTAYIYSGCYSLPFPTLTGSIVSDLILIDKVIGAGELALSDHRSSYPGLPELKKTAADIHLGGLLGGKAGVMHIHMGDGKAGLKPLLELVGSTDLPFEEFVPTHTNRNPALFDEALRYCLDGGHIDLTSGEKAGIAVPEAVKTLIEAGAAMKNVTVSSDANGSSPSGGVNDIMTLYEDIVSCVRDKGIPPETAFGLVTENVARLLKLYPRKGVLSEQSDADILITDKNYNVKKLFCRGRLVLDLK